MSLSSSNRLPARTEPIVVNPVMFPPGREKLATKPAATGSPEPMKMIGAFVVAFFAISAPGVEGTVKTSTFKRSTLYEPVQSVEFIIGRSRFDYNILVLLNQKPKSKTQNGII